MASDDKRFLIFNAESMKLFAEQAGHPAVADNVLMLLNEDVNYRLRELVRNSAQFMKHSRRRKLTCDDVNKALKWSDCQVVYGHGINCEDLVLDKPDGERCFAIDDQADEVNLIKYADHIIQSNNRLDLAINSRTLNVKWLNATGKSAISLLEKNRQVDGQNTSTSQNAAAVS